MQAPEQHSSGAPHGCLSSTQAGAQDLWVHAPEQHSAADSQSWPLGVQVAPPGAQSLSVQVPEQQSVAEPQSWPLGVQETPPGAQILSVHIPEQHSAGKPHGWPSAAHATAASGLVVRASLCRFASPDVCASVVAFASLAGTAASAPVSPP